jgi:hypothetical protein
VWNLPSSKSGEGWETNTVSFYVFGALASLLLVPGSQPRAFWEQLRESLRRKEDFFLC